jgi:8-oxo-dGTP pyrophosphatase MutT (NUDIX family)
MTIEDQNLIKQNVVKALIVDEGKILFLWDPNITNKDKWETPGGRIRPNESDAEALIREAKEEAGIEIEVESPIDEWEFPILKKGWLLVGKSFLCRPITKEVKLEDEEKQHTKYLWVDIEEAKKMDLTDWLKQSLTYL